MSDPTPGPIGDLAEALGNPRARFWTCLNPAHRFVEWAGETATCRDCGLTSEMTGRYKKALHKHVVEPALREVYRERARLLAFLTRVFPAVITNNDRKEPERWVIYLATPAGQVSWHLHFDDLPLFAAAGVEVVDGNDPRARWDEHSVQEKYARLTRLTVSGGPVVTVQAADLSAVLSYVIGLDSIIGPTEEIGRMGAALEAATG